MIMAVFRNTVCFVLLGLLSILYVVLSFAAVQDIFAGSNLPTSTVILALTIPETLGKLIAPWLVHRSFLLSFVVVVVLDCAGVGVIVLVEYIPLRLVGVCCFGAGLAIGHVATLSMTARYSNVEELTSACVAGDNSAALVTSFYYTGLSTWLCVAPRTTIAITLPLAFLFLLLYYLLDKDELRLNAREQIQPARDRSQEPTPQSREWSSDGYMALVNREDFSGDETESNVDGNKSQCSSSDQSNSYMESLIQKMKLFNGVLPVAFFLYCDFFAVFLSQTAVITTVAFPDAPFSPRDHFLYYMLSFGVFRMFGGSYLLVVFRAFPKLMPYVTISKVWILALVDLGHLTFFIVMSWYRFMPYFSVMVTLCATQGLVSSVLHANSLIVIANRYEDTEERGVALGLVTAGVSAGILAAGIAGVFLESNLRMHCMNELHLNQYCLTRYNVTVGWYTNLHCQK